MTPEQMKILVVGDRAWGKADTLGEALTNMVQSGGKRSQFIAYVVHPDSTITGMGDISYPTDFPPKEIHRVGVKKAA
jgi:hypothetical protein